MLDAVVWFFTNIAMAFWNLGWALTHPAAWLDWSDGEALMRFIYYGASVELFFVILTTLVILTSLGLWRRSIMWGTVRILEGFANGVGRFFAWAGLLMVLQQIVIVFSQRIFASSELGFGFGNVATFDLSWWSEELKLYNAMIVALCCAYTFVQGGHVRVDLIYAPVSFRTKKVIDMFGSLVFMLPLTIIIWLFSWYFMWRSMITPPVTVTDDLDRLMLKARAVRWNIETIGFSPNGFDAYILFKVLILCFAGTMFIMAWGAFYRAMLEFIEGPESEGKYLDKDTLGDEIAEAAAEIH